MSTLVAENSLAWRVASVDWYHSIRLTEEIVTPGSFDTLDELARVPFPTSLAGKRCLDVATSDGFWAFEMERRGASEVVAIDVLPERMDWPGHAAFRPPADATTQRGMRPFEVAREAFGSNVQWREVSAYELSPAVVGEFDFVFVGSLLLHLRDPVAALAGIARVLRGEVLSVDAISVPLTVLHPRTPVARFDPPGWPLWWALNLKAYRTLFAAAGLQTVESGRPFFLKRGPGYRAGWGADISCRPSFCRHPAQATLACLGNLHAWVRATAD
jgi:tRNA (mo5U34)-methyltransferase